MLDVDLKEKLASFALSDRQLTVLTGTGISAESGLPTFRGYREYWRVGGKEYLPHQLATRRMFEAHPDDVWSWYLYLRGLCRRARPNPGHLALVEMERLFFHRFTLITQCIDGLHLRAGNQLKNICQIHGNVFYMRCDGDCSHAVYPIGPEIPDKTRGERLTDAERRLLRCPECGGPTRPHTLWYDETYNEEHYRYVSALKTATSTGLLLVVGTSGNTNLSVLIAQKTARRLGLIVDVNIRETPFSGMAVRSGGGFVNDTCTLALPAILKVFSDQMRTAI